MRLHKFLAQAGVSSRRSAETLIRDGRVTVNGTKVTELGTQIDPERDQVSVDGAPVSSEEERATIVLNKPAGTVSTMADPEGRRTVAELVTAEKYRLVPIGRLDYHTEGVLLMTNDGELAHRLLHPRYKVPKVYAVKIAGHPNGKALDQLRAGVELEDGRTQPAVVEVMEEEEKATWLELVISEGRQRQVRRMVEAVGHRALRVVRTAFATFAVDDLKPGQYRYLSKSELGTLYRIAGFDELPVPLSERAKASGTRPIGEGERSKGPLPGESQGRRPRTRRGAGEEQAAEREAKKERRREREARFVPRRGRGGPRRDDARGDRGARFEPRRRPTPRRDDGGGDREARFEPRRSGPRRGDGGGDREARFEPRRSAGPRRGAGGGDRDTRFEPRHRSSPRRDDERGPPRGRRAEFRAASDERGEVRPEADAGGGWGRRSEPRGGSRERFGARPRGQDRGPRESSAREGGDRGGFGGRPRSGGRPRGRPRGAGPRRGGPRRGGRPRGR